MPATQTLIGNIFYPYIRSLTASRTKSRVGFVYACIRLRRVYITHNFDTRVLRHAPSCHEDDSSEFKATRLKNNHSPARCVIMDNNF